MSEATRNQFHLSLNVADLASAVDFYRKALGVEPAKTFPDYAKFELSDPPLVLSLEPGAPAGGQRLNHLGVRVPESNALRPFATRIQAWGLDAQYLAGVECCYSRQTKFCLTDPDGNLIEFYTLDEELAHAAPKPTAEAAAAPGNGAIWEHMLGTDFPEAIPAASAELDEVRLRGTFNRRLDAEAQRRVLGEVRRVLKPGGKLMVHGLVADREIHQQLPTLPGPAALVEHTPVESEMVQALEAAGFVAVVCKRFSHAAVFQFGGAEMRELMLTAVQPPASEGAYQEVVYRGPFREVIDDHGRTYQRGRRTRVDGHGLAALRQSELADSFVFLNASAPQPDRACHARAEETAPANA